MAVRDQIIVNIPIAMRVLGLCAWLGGMLILGAVVAPAIFKTLNNNALAGEIFGKCLKKMNFIAFVSAGLIFLAEIPSLRSQLPASFIRLAFLIVATGIFLHLHFGLFPEIEKRQSNFQSPAFDKLHKQYTTEARVGIYALLPIVFLAGVEGGMKGRKK